MLLKPFVCFAISFISKFIEKKERSLRTRRSWKTIMFIYIVYLEIRFDFLARILETVMESIKMKDITTLIMPSNNPVALVGKWNLIFALSLFFYGILHLLFYVQRKRFENVFWTIFLLVFSKEILP